MGTSSRHRPASAAVPRRDLWPGNGVIGEITRGTFAGKWVLAEAVSGLTGDTDDDFYILHLPTRRLRVDDFGAIIMDDGVTDRWHASGGGLIDELTDQAGVIWSTDEEFVDRNRDLVTGDRSSEERTARRKLAAIRMSKRRRNAAAPIRSALSRTNKLILRAIQAAFLLIVFAVVSVFIWTAVWNFTVSSATCTVGSTSIRDVNVKRSLVTSYYVDTAGCGRLVLDSHGIGIAGMESVLSELEPRRAYVFTFHGWEGTFPRMDRSIRDVQPIVSAE